MSSRNSKTMSISGFCRRNRISRSTYYALQDQGLGPATLKIGRSVRISRSAEKHWRRRMESGEAADFNSKRLRDSSGSDADYW